MMKFACYDKDNNWIGELWATDADNAERIVASHIDFIDVCYIKQISD